MGTSDVKERLKESKVDRFQRMRLGQSVAEIAQVPSNPDVQLALVPLFEEELHQAQIATGSKDFPYTIFNQRIYERWEQREILIRSIRQEDDFEIRIFDTVEELMDLLEPTDVNYLAEQYMALAEHSSPAIEGFTEEQITDLKKVLTMLDWNALSGRQWFLLKNFLSILLPEQLEDKLAGSGLTKWLTGIVSGIDSVENADQKSTITSSAPDVENDQELLEASNDELTRPVPILNPELQEKS